MINTHLPVATIIASAVRNNIDLKISNGKLLVKPPQGVYPPNAKEYIIAYKEQIICELLCQEMPELCSTCEAEGRETPALPDHHETYMYCAAHHPAHCEPQHETVQPVEPVPCLPAPATPPIAEPPIATPVVPDQSTHNLDQIRRNPVVSEALRLFGPCEVHIDPPGYTLATHIASGQFAIEEEARRLKERQLRHPVRA